MFTTYSICEIQINVGIFFWKLLNNMAIVLDNLWRDLAYMYVQFLENKMYNSNEKNILAIKLRKLSVWSIKNHL